MVSQTLPLELLWIWNLEVQICNISVFAVNFQEGLVAASQPITVNCSVYDGSCDYQIIYEAHAVPHMNVTQIYIIKISIHALLYACTTFSQLIVM